MTIDQRNCNGSANPFGERVQEEIVFKNPKGRMNPSPPPAPIKRKIDFDWPGSMEFIQDTSSCALLRRLNLLQVSEYFLMRLANFYTISLNREKYTKKFEIVHPLALTKL